MILLHTIFKEEYNGVDQKDNKSEESDSTGKNCLQAQLIVRK